MWLFLPWQGLDPRRSYIRSKDGQVEREARSNVGPTILKNADSGARNFKAISVIAPQVFDAVKPGEPIKLDDGKIEGFIRSVNGDEMEVEVTRAKERGR